MEVRVVNKSGVAPPLAAHLLDVMGKNKRIEEARESGTETLSFVDQGLKTWPKELVPLLTNAPKVLPDAVRDYPPQLEILTAFDNNLTAIPQCFPQLKNLWSLNLVNNKITDVPPGFGGCAKLRVLDLSCNMLTTLRADPLLNDPATLRALYLSDNRLTQLPREIGQFKLLRTLCLRDNDITALPDTIGQLVALRELLLQGNKLVLLPTALASCTSLLLPNSRLKLAFNPLHDKYVSKLKDGGAEALFEWLKSTEHETLLREEAEMMAKKSKKT
ncbi:hypothetical protein HDU93_002834 [Gonapodya sp. JEL0774]|nr:hypothetical protein HDU93_002834 [Gonapodya sp. JEL0774]